jgi:hypothetical protein
VEGGGGGSFANLFDTPATIAANRIIHGNAAGDALSDSEEVNILSTGELLVGTATLITATDVAEFIKTQNAGTALAIRNETDGTSATAKLNLVSSTGPTIAGSIELASASWTPVTGREASALNIVAHSEHIVIVTRADKPIKLGTDGDTDLANSTRVEINKSAIQPGANDRIALGAPGTAFSDLALATGAVIDFGNTDYTATHSAGVLTLSGELEIDGNLNHDGTNVGLYGVTPVVRSAGWTITNDGADRAFDADTVAVGELADVVATLIKDLAATGIIGAAP